MADHGQPPGWCVHYAAPNADTGICAAGVVYAEIWRGVPFQARPCFLIKGQPKPGSIDCPHRRLPTAEEMAKNDEAERKNTEVLMQVLELAERAVWAPGEKEKVVQCPKCTGRLHFIRPGRAFRAVCETPDCFSAMA